jgi:hypothetical protein
MLIQQSDRPYSNGWYRQINTQLESLILAQNERWRQA